MDPRLLDLYEQELRYFRESGGEFARAYPKIAARLGIDQLEVTDPYVERLIEATSFLSARVLLKLDAQYPRFASHLLDIVYPHLLAPTPSMAVLAIEPDLDDAKLARGPTIERGSSVRALLATGQETHCEFRLASNIRLWPIEVTGARYFTYAPDLPMGRMPHAREIRGGLRITLRSRAGLKFSQIEGLDELPLHLGGDSSQAWQLYACALSDPIGVMVLPYGQPSYAQFLPSNSIQAIGFDDDESLLPQTITGFSGFRLIQEYFAFSHRFEFISLEGLAPILSKMENSLIEVVLLFSHAQPTLEKLVGVENVQLHCVNAINLFAKRLDRVAISEGQNEFHLVPDRRRPMDFEVHSILEVLGHSAAQLNGEKHTVQEQRFLPFYSAFHDARFKHPAYYTITREPRQLSDHQKAHGTRTSHIGSEVYLQLVDPQQAPYSQSLRQLSVLALCSNRDLPLLLPLGRENDFELVQSNPVRRIRAVRGPSRPFSPVVSAGLGWRILDHLAINHLSLSDSSEEKGAAALREMLSLYAMHGDGSTMAQVQGLRSVSSQSVTRRLPLAGPIAFGRGLQVRLTIDPNAFHGHSAFLFGSVLTHYLARHVEVNHFVETQLFGEGLGQIMCWRPRCGTRPIL